MTLAPPPIETFDDCVEELTAFRWNWDTYLQADAAGLFEGRRVMMIEGEVLEMPPIGLEHAKSTRKALYALQKLFDPETWTVQVQGPFHVSHRSDPQPDLLVIRGRADQVEGVVTERVLAVEVSMDMLRFDRTTKSRLYAAAGVPEYWIINCVDRQLEVHVRPHAVSGDSHAYDPAIIYKPGQSVRAIEAAIEVRVDDLLP